MLANAHVAAVLLLGGTTLPLLSIGTRPLSWRLRPWQVAAGIPE